MTIVACNALKAFLPARTFKFSPWRTVRFVVNFYWIQDPKKLTDVEVEATAKAISSA